ncbi:unnamed protein product [Coregonus sp. 'balchen']|nr:unnamed protein product [Coregonus sp. 'balchen']
MSVSRTIVMPIAHEFSPDMVLVSSGFDAVKGHPAPLGGYKVSAKSVLERRPSRNAVLSLQRVIQAQGEYWRSLRVVSHTVDQSYLQAQGQSLRRNLEDHNDTVTHRDELMEGDSDSM